jgi:hypothetical protein
MDGHYHEITQFAVGDLTKEQAEQIELAMSAAMVFAIMERLRGNTSFTRPTTKIEPM